MENFSEIICRGGGGVHVGFRMWGRGKTLESGGGGVYELGRCKWARM